MEPYQLSWIYGEFLSIGSWWVFFCGTNLHSCVWVYYGSRPACCTQEDVKSGYQRRKYLDEFYQAFNYRINHVEIISRFKRKKILYVRVCFWSLAAFNLTQIIVIVWKTQNPMKIKENSPGIYFVSSG